MYAICTQICCVNVVCFFLIQKHFSHSYLIEHRDDVMKCSKLSSETAQLNGSTFNNDIIKSLEYGKVQSA